MSLELFCCDGCGNVSQKPDTTGWQPFQLGRFAFSVLIHALCPQCNERGIAASPLHFSSLVGDLKRHALGKDESLVSDSHTIVHCPSSQGGCGHFTVLQNGIPVGARYTTKPYVDAARVDERELPCPHCKEQADQRKKHKKKGRKKHKKKIKGTKH